MREINLLQGSPHAYQKPKVSLPPGSGRGIMWFFLIVLVLEVAVGGVLYTMRSGIEGQTQSAEAEITQIMTEVESKKDELNEAVAAQSALKSFADILGEHRRWSKVLTELSDTTLKIARYNALQAEGTDSEFIIGGIVDTYTDLGKVILGLETSGEFEKVQLLATETNELDAKVIFEIYVDVKEDLLANHEAPPAPLSAPASQSGNSSQQIFIEP